MPQSSASTCRWTPTSTAARCAVAVGRSIEARVPRRRPARLPLSGLIRAAGGGYGRPEHQVTLRVNIYAEAVGVLTDKIHSLRSCDSPNSDKTALAAGAAVTTARSLVVGAPAVCPGSVPPAGYSRILLPSRAAVDSR
jgi:hypothetical protein